jgi:hypothetical protein
MNNRPQAELASFIVRAKAATYIGNGNKLLPYRLGSHDLQFADGDWAYHDSYLGESDFIGQEVVYFRQKPVWAMNYFGRLLQPDQITSATIGQMLKTSLSKMYAEGRFLGAFEHVEEPLRYVDTNNGDITYFEGIETVYQRDMPVYRLVYHGGLIRD